MKAIRTRAEDLTVANIMKSLPNEVVEGNEPLLLILNRTSMRGIVVRQGGDLTVDLCPVQVEHIEGKIQVTEDSSKPVEAANYKEIAAYFVQQTQLVPA